jgi:hypothetical protein
MEGVESKMYDFGRRAILVVPHLLSHGTFVYVVSFDGLPNLVAFNN